MKKSLLLLLMAPVLQGCLVYGGNTQSQFAAINKIECTQPSQELYIFTEGESIEFDYVNIGMIEVQGGEFASLEEVFEALKNEAKRNCANAIIHIKQSTTVRETGVVFDDPSEEDLYTSSVLTGIAIKVEIDEHFREKYASRLTP